MSDRVPAQLRTRARQRAGDRCEYCLIHANDVMFSHQPDHIIAVKHGGKTTEANLAWACFLCNRFKGSDIASIDPETDDLAPLFHPRHDLWREHFRLEEGQIIPLTAVGRVTARLLRFNSLKNVELRSLLQLAGRLFVPD